MEFGKVESIDFGDIDFSLPADSDQTKATLAAAMPARDFKVYVGATRWGNKGWIGKIYPPKINDKELLREYAKHFNSVEHNATFYAIPKPEDVLKWKGQVADRPDFRFAPKLPQSITNARRLKNAEDLSAQFLIAITHLGNKLGPISIQLAETFSPKSFENLEKYLREWPKEIQVAVEVRHKGWYQDPDSRKALFETLRKYNAGTIITDVAGRRDCAHMELTTPHALIRFVGNDLHPTDFTRADAWVQRIRQWKEMGLQSLWFFVHEADENNSPAMAEYFINKLNEELGTNVQAPMLIKHANTLF